MKRPLEKITDDAVVFRDDDRGGYKAILLRSPADGDFYLSVVPDWRDMTEEDERERTSPCFGASIRLRMPMIGGGDHAELYEALAKLWNKHIDRAPIVEPPVPSVPQVSETTKAPEGAKVSEPNA